MQKTHSFMHLELKKSRSVNGMMLRTARRNMIYLKSIDGIVEIVAGRPLLLWRNQLFLKLLYQKNGVTSMLMKAPVGISLLI